jgi:hypothetical protein
LLVFVWLLFEVSEIKEQGSAHKQSLVFLGSVGGEVNSEVIRVRHHSLSTARASLLEGGDDFTRRSLDVEIDSLTALKRALAVHTDLEAASINDVFQVVVLVIDFVDDVEAGPWVSDLANVLTLSIFNPSNGHFGSVEAVASALARSVEQQERFVVEFLTVVFEVDLELERSAVTAHALLGAETGFFLALEELLAFLFTILAQWEHIVGVVLFTTREHFHKVELLLDEDTASFSKSVETLLCLLFRGGLRRVASWWVSILLWWVASWWVLLGWVLLWGILLWGILLGWVLLGRVLLRRITTLLRRIASRAAELDLDSGLLSWLHYWKLRWY